MKVWLVWQGIYSSKEVVAVAQNEKIANKLKEIYSSGKYKEEAYITEADFVTYENYRIEKAFHVEREDNETRIVEVRSIEYAETCFEEFNDVYDYGPLDVWVKADDPEEAISMANALFDAYESKKGKSDDLNPGQP